MALGERLQSLINKLGLTQTSLARSLSTSNVVVNRYINNKTIPDYNFLYKLNSAFNVSINWLISGDGPMFVGEHIRSFRGKNYYNLPIVAAVSCGSPEEIEQAEPEDYILVDSQQLPGNLADYFAFYANGESMSPYICHGDVVIVKHHDVWETADDRICVVRIDGEITLKKVTVFSEGKEILLSPFNKEYSPILIAEERSYNARLIGIGVMAVKNL
ncbi:MAG: LexA family transcriptional regulator [Candidatus Cloacimonetes bacterium]|nr:LexA family transcriptional regulator [Candidatus Cloacimonadota bacterium]